MVWELQLIRRASFIAITIRFSLHSLRETDGRLPVDKVNEIHSVRVFLEFA